MKRILFAVSLLLLSSILILSGCGGSQSVAAPSTTSSQATSSSQTTTPAGEAKYGGSLRIISTGGPQNVGYMPKQSFADATPGTLWAERILELKTDGTFAPSLAESWEMGADLKSVTLHLREGVKFQDGTDWNADAAVWSFTTSLETGALGGARYIVDIKATDEYTVLVTMNSPFNQMIYRLARIYMFSPTAYEQNGEEWAINHAVSTAAFQVTDFQRDVVVKMKKFDGYWRPGLPYLDTVELTTVKDPATCSAMIQSGQADAWMGSTAQETADLKAAGFQIVETATTYNILYPDSKNPDSPFANQQVREAVEYAIDRSAMAEALGFGFQVPVNQPTHPGTQGYNPNYPVREFNPDKAKQLLAEAGYPNGFKTTMIVGQTATNAGAIIKNYLNDVNIEVELDIADTGRFWGSINGGWDGLLYGPLAVNPQYSVAWLDHVGPQPLMQFASMAKSQAYTDICEQVTLAPDLATMEKLTMDMVTQAGVDAMFIPLTLNMGTSVFKSNFHTEYYSSVDWTYWQIYNDYWIK